MYNRHLPVFEIFIFDVSCKIYIRPWHWVFSIFVCFSIYHHISVWTIWVCHEGSHRRFLSYTSLCSGVIADAFCKYTSVMKCHHRRVNHVCKIITSQMKISDACYPHMWCELICVCHLWIWHSEYSSNQLYRLSVWKRWKHILILKTNP